MRVENLENSSDFDTIPVSLTTQLAPDHGLHDGTPFPVLHWLLVRFLPHLFYH